jgi:hypothetical protein
VTLRPISLLLLTACSAPADLPGTAPPPALAATAAVQGAPVTLTASGLLPGARVWFARAARQGPGPCYPQLQGRCLDVHTGVTLAGSGVADSGGVATLTFTVPPSAPVGATAWFQAVAAAAQGAVTTPPLQLQVTAGQDLCEAAQAFFDDTCVGCHGEDRSGGLDLRDAAQIVGQPANGAWMLRVDPAGDAAARLENSYIWHKLSGTHLTVGGSGSQMPPWGALSPLELAPVRAWVEAGGACAAGEAPPVTPLTTPLVPLHRLNRAEYNNTVRDLLGTDLRPADAFPIDDARAGFDNMASALSISTLHAEGWEQAAETLALEFVDRHQIGGPELNTVDVLRQGEGPDMAATVGGVIGSGWCLWSVGDLSTTVSVPSAGTYRLTVAAWSPAAGPDLARMELKVDGVLQATHSVAATSSNAPGTYALDVALTPGPHVFAARFTNDYYNTTDPLAVVDRNLFIDWVQLVGPTSAPQVGVPGDSPYAAGITCDPAAEGATACFERLFGPLLRMAWRRPIEPVELSSVVWLMEDLMAEGLSYREAVTGGLQAALLSPDFLLRPELDPNGPFNTTPQPLSDHELASRLSYFLWSSMPDAALLDLADQGALRDPAMLRAQAARMLADPRADALIENYAGQWLWLRKIPTATPDPALFPGWTPTLQAAAAEEARRLVGRYIRSHTDFRDLFTTTDIELNGELAAWYGLGGGADWALTDVSGVERYGVLTNAGLIAALSNPTRSNPVRRGRYILEQLLCAHTGDPPPGVIALFDPSEGEGSLRERFQDHRSNPVCASCHDTIDPLGFSLEGYGPAGQRREVDDLGYPVDTQGTLPDGRTFDGAAGLSQVLAEDPRLPLCVTSTLLSYALGDELSPALFDDLHTIHGAFAEGGMVFEDLVLAIVASRAFTERGE